MPILTRPEFGPRIALTYVTCGALLDVWTLVWYFTYEGQLTSTAHFWIIGLFLTGLTFVILGLFLGRLGRAARQDELPPVEAIKAETEIQKIAAANSSQLAASQETTPGNPSGAAVTPTGMPLMPLASVPFPASTRI